MGDPVLDAGVVGVAVAVGVATYREQQQNIPFLKPLTAQ